VDVLEINARASNCLKAAGIFTIHQLINKTEWDLRKLPNLGKGTLKDIIYSLGSNGLTLKSEGETK
jgi:DNA-directed RNA polymerase subunit alpha